MIIAFFICKTAEKRIHYNDFVTLTSIMQLVAPNYNGRTCFFLFVASLNWNPATCSICVLVAISSRICMCALLSLSTYCLLPSVFCPLLSAICLFPSQLGCLVLPCPCSNCCMAQFSVVQPPPTLGCHLFAHIFFKFCHKNWFMWLPQNVCCPHATRLRMESPPAVQCTACLSAGWCWFVNLKSGSRVKCLHWKLLA